MVKSAGERDKGCSERVSKKEEQSVALWNALKGREQFLTRASLTVSVYAAGGGAIGRESEVASINYHIVVGATLDATVRRGEQRDLIFGIFVLQREHFGADAVRANKILPPNLSHPKLFVTLSLLFQRALPTTINEKHFTVWCEGLST